MEHQKLRRLSKNQSIPADRNTCEISKDIPRANSQIVPANTITEIKLK